MKGENKVLSVKAMEKYGRGKGLTKRDLKQTKDKKVRHHLQKHETRVREAADLIERSKILLTSQPGSIEVEDDGLEKTYKLSQEELLRHVPLASVNKVFDLGLPYGPYTFDYSRNGRGLLLGGAKGHHAAFEWKSGKLFGESHLKERIHAVKWLHNETLYAVAQRKCVYMYDQSGLEVHVLKKHSEATHLDFLPYHMLLASSGRHGLLTYQDTSTGAIVAEWKTRLGPTLALTQNPSNAILHLGHAGGTVTLWSPNLSSPHVKMLCHRGPIQDIAIHRSGTFMATCGLDGQVKLWDLRKYQCLQAYSTPTAPSSLDISQLGLLSVTFGATVYLWKDAFATKQASPYMTHCVPGATLHSARFCPYDDVLGLGHTKGFSSILIPGMILLFHRGTCVCVMCVGCVQKHPVVIVFAVADSYTCIVCRFW